MNVPFMDLKIQYEVLKEEIKAAIDRVLDSQRFILGPEVGRLEEAIAQHLGAKYAVGVSSGTDALLISLMALGIKAGDLVITSNYSFFATAGVITRLGAKPVFVDINPLTFNMETKNLKNLLKKGEGRYKAVIPVHLFGQCADMDGIMKLAKDYKLEIIEDAAQAIGAKYKDKPAGSIGQAGCFSFYPTKNLGGCGDAGMVLTNDDELAEKLRILRVHGAKTGYYHSIIGGNFRLDAVQAAVLLVKLKYLDEWTDKRQENAERYNRLFEENKLKEFVKLPYIAPGNFHIFNQYVIRLRQRNQLREFLKQQGIGTEIYYPLPFSLQECFSSLGHKKGDFPISEKAAQETLALPIYPELAPFQQEYIVKKISEFFAGE